MKTSNGANRLLIHLNEVADAHNQDYRHLNRGGSSPASFLTSLDEVLVAEGLYPNLIRFHCNGFEFEIFNCLGGLSFDFGGRPHRLRAMSCLNAASLVALRRIGEDCKWSSALRAMAAWSREFGVIYNEVTLQFPHEVVRIRQSSGGNIKVSLCQKSNGHTKPNGSRVRPASQVSSVA